MLSVPSTFDFSCIRDWISNGILLAILSWYATNFQFLFDLRAFRFCTPKGLSRSMMKISKSTFNRSCRLRYEGRKLISEQSSRRVLLHSEKLLREQSVNNIGFSKSTALWKLLASEQWTIGSFSAGCRIISYCVRESWHTQWFSLQCLW